MDMSRARTRSAPARALCSLLVLACALVLLTQQARAEIGPFVGSYTGNAEVTQLDGTKIPRDMSVMITETKDGFSVRWTSVTYKASGKVSEKSYSVDFVPSGRGNVYAAAQRKNVFGHEVQLDPMKGEPYVWSRIDGDTLTVYSLFVDINGGYSLQQYDRTLSEGGLTLRFQNIRDGEILRAVETFLAQND